MPSSRNIAIVAFTNPTRAGCVAQALHEHDVLPLVAFSRRQLLHCLEDCIFHLVVMDERIGGAELVDLVRARVGPALPILTLGADGETLESTSAEVDLSMTSESEVVDVTRRALSLLRINEPVILPASMSWGSLELDVGRREAKWDGVVVGFTPIQFRIMEVLMLATGAVVTSQELSRRLWGDTAFHDSERVLAHIRRIRKKIESSPSHPEYLLTVRGEGYRLADRPMVEPDIDLTGFEDSPISSLAL